MDPDEKKLVLYKMEVEKTGYVRPTSTDGWRKPFKRSDPEWGGGADDADETPAPGGQSGDTPPPRKWFAPLSPEERAEMGLGGEGGLARSKAGKTAESFFLQGAAAGTADTVRLNDQVLPCCFLVFLFSCFCFCFVFCVLCLCLCFCRCADIEPSLVQCI